MANIRRKVVIYTLQVRTDSGWRDLTSDPTFFESTVAKAQAAIRIAKAEGELRSMRFRKVKVYFRETKLPPTEARGTA